MEAAESVSLTDRWIPSADFQGYQSKPQLSANMLGATFIGKEPSWGGSSANGKGWSRKRRAAVPSEARRLARLLRPLEANPPGSDDGAEGRHDAISIVLTVVEKVASVSVDISRFERLLRANLDKTKQRHSDTDTTPQDESLCTAVAIHQVFHQRNTFKFTLPRKSFVDAGDKAEPDLDGDTSIDGQHKRRKTAYNMFFAEFARKVDAEARSLNKIVVGGYASLAREEWGKLSDDEKATYARKANRRNLAATHTCSLLQTAPPGTMDAPATTTTTEREVSKSETITFVSDSESARSTSTAVDNSQISRKEDHLDPDSLWRSFVECLRIEALSRIPPSAWRDTADTFDVYRFHQPVRIQNTSSHVLQRLCEKIQQYFLSAYDGYQSGSLRRTRGRKRAAKGCRVYTVWDDKNGALLIQICVGGALHGTTTSVSELEFTAVAEPNCCCVALSSGSGHSGKRVIPVVLSALEACLAQFDQTGGGSLYGTFGAQTRLLNALDSYLTLCHSIFRYRSHFVSTSSRAFRGRSL